MDTEQLYQMIETRESWEVFILDTVRQEKMDPWDIDITRLADKCMQKIRLMKKFDFTVPGKVVLSSAILLRMKSDKLVLRDTRQLIEEYMEQYADDLDELPKLKEMGEFPLLEPVVIRAPQSKVTVEDLLGSLRKVLKDREKKTWLEREREAAPLKLEMPEFNIKEAIDNLMIAIKEKIRGLPFVRFFDIASRKSRQEIAQTFLPLLHLANDGMVRIEQEQHLGPIKIYIGGEDGQEAG